MIGDYSTKTRDLLQRLTAFFDQHIHPNEERYLREVPLHEHAALPRGYLWAADPAGRTAIEELRAANHKVLRGDNSIRLGIAAVTARIRTGRLKVCEPGCPNLIQEAKLYRYPSPSERAVASENRPRVRAGQGARLPSNDVDGKGYQVDLDLLKPFQEGLLVRRHEMLILRQVLDINREPAQLVLIAGALVDPGADHV